MIRRILPGLWDGDALGRAYAILRMSGLCSLTLFAALWCAIRLETRPSEALVLPFALDAGWLAAMLGASFLVDVRRAYVVHGDRLPSFGHHLCAVLTIVGSVLLAGGSYLMLAISLSVVEASLR